MSTPLRRLSVIGAGAWGTALALVVARAGGTPMLWAHESDVVASINAGKGNPFLPDAKLPPAIRATVDLAEAAAGVDALLIAVPAQHLRAVCAKLAPHCSANTILVVCAKGVEIGTSHLMSDVATEACFGSPIAVLSGPTFAAEVAKGLPTAVTLASMDIAAGKALVAALGSPTFRPYLSDDIIGAQIGGAVKNVIAIACGIVEGRGLGDNARAALMTRGLVEIMRLGEALGGKRETLMGLSGLGDLALTCNGHQSRNMSLGIALGQGKTLAQATAGKNSIAEGVPSAAAVSTLAAKRGVEMPIVNAVNDILHKNAKIEAMIAGLLERPFRSEGEL
jgi:glycerol-3-phosphate dehydrogenase (NAD(P)+)